MNGDTQYVTHCLLSINTLSLWVVLMNYFLVYIHTMPRKTGCQSACGKVWSLKSFIDKMKNKEIFRIQKHM